MERILKLIYGYVVVLIGGEQLERFLNLCRNRIRKKKMILDRFLSLWHDY